jgi:hypothetical protein
MENAGLREMFKEFKVAVDQPDTCLWKKLSRDFPETLVLLSVRDTGSRWRSADKTIFNDARNEAPPGHPFVADWHAMLIERKRSSAKN